MSDEFKAWLREICERHRDALEEIGWVEVVRCEECAIRYTSCPMVVRQGRMFTFFTEDDDYCSYGVAKGERDGEIH